MSLITVQNIDTHMYKVHSDLPGYQTSNGGSLPPSLTITTLKPDIVILDNQKKEAAIFELTVPFESNIHKQHKYKTNKYAHFEKDIKTHNTSVSAFEIGSRGTITPDNLTRLGNIHKYLNKNIKKSLFIKNIKALTSDHPLIILHIHSQEAHSLGKHRIYQCTLLKTHTNITNISV